MVNESEKPTPFLEPTKEKNLHKSVIKLKASCHDLDSYIY